ncbi:MAG TPA: hypothetical protein VFZ49_02485 [Pyrinomonadaceae bacterium]
MESDQRIVKTARAILRRLVAGRYDELEFLSENNFPQEEIRYAIHDYPADPIEPPDEFDATVDVVEIDDSSTQSWNVVIPLWTAEEGQSDLCIVITCIDREKLDGTLDFEIDGLWVP